MTDWKELFPVEGIAPLIGGILLWFGVNYLFIAPEIIGPRLAEKYYLPACQSAVAEGRQARQRHIADLIKRGEIAMAQAAQVAQQQAQQRAQQATGTMFGMLFGGRPESDAFMQRYGGQMQGWADRQSAPAVGMAVQQQIDQARRAFTQQMQTEEREARAGILHATPAAFCGCVVDEGLMKDRFQLAAHTASLRLFTPDGVRRLQDGTIFNDARACGRPPVV